MGLAQAHTDYSDSAPALCLPSPLPVIIVGAGPVGVRALQQLRQLAPQQAVLIYGDEAYAPYDRVQLSGVLAGVHQLQDIALAANLLANRESLRQFHSSRIVSIDREARTVTDAQGNQQPYSSLILATGSRPFVPAAIAGGLPGTYTFRDMADAEKLAARRALSTHTVVLGAGLLGIEAARAMQRHNTRVTLVDHNPHPMFRQLDSVAGALLQDQLTESGLELRLGSSVRQVLGSHRVEGVVLRSGEKIACDTVIVATGIRPNLDLASSAGLAFGRGISVNDYMQTSDPDIYAIGECCEHAGEVFGLVAPGYEQAAIAARAIATPQSAVGYLKTQLATSLKVAGLAVFSMGDAQPPASMRSVSWREGNLYRRLTLVAGRIVSINAIGDWPELPVLREMVKTGKRLAPWRVWQFRRSGTVLPASGLDGVGSWPAAAVVCNCNGVTKGDICRALPTIEPSLQAITRQTGAGGSCGSCKPLLQTLLGGSAAVEPVERQRTLATLTVTTAIICLIALGFALPYPNTVQLDFDWGMLWRDASYKQYSGFTMLGLGVLSLVFSLRKRLRSFGWGKFIWWRIAHVVITALAMVALFVHTGFSLGSNLNLALSLIFIGLLLAGSLLGISIACEHRLQPALARQLRAAGQWAHVLLSWPLPALLSAHILKTYYF
jgi:nitrite reductase (NADH) large subunit